MFYILKIKDIIEIEPGYFPNIDECEINKDNGTLTFSTTTEASLSDKAQSSHTDGLEANTVTPYRVTFRDLLWHRISEKYVMRVIPHQGLCVTVHTVDSYTQAAIRGTDGAAWSTVTFSIIIARPRVGQRLLGNIISQDETGIYLSLEFIFIFVPSHLLIETSKYDKTMNTWYLPIGGDDEDARVIQSDVTTPPEDRNDYEIGSEVIVAIDSVFVRAVSDTGISEKLAPMEIIGSFKASYGLGPCQWFEE